MFELLLLPLALALPKYSPSSEDTISPISTGDVMATWGTVSGALRFPASRSTAAAAAAAAAAE